MDRNEEDLKYLKFYQYMYKKGNPILEDKDYDKFVKELQVRGLNPNLSWEDVTEDEGIEVMYDLRIGVTSEKEITFSPSEYVTIENTSQNIIEEFNEFKSDKNRSIPIVTDNALFTQFYELFKESGTEEVLAALKLDGWNITMFVKEGEIVYARTRGKLTEETDVTSIMKGILRNIDGELKIKKGYVVGELYLMSDTLPYLRTKYRKEFKTTRNSVSSFLSNKITAEDLPLAQFGAFKLELEDKIFSTPEEMYLELQENGFQIPVYEKIECDLKSMAQLVINWSSNINHLPPSDGIVFMPNNYNIKNALLQIPGIAGSYETGIYAVKMGAWGEQVYKTIVEEITFTSNTKSRRPSLTVKPIKTRDGRTVTTVPIDHIGRLVDEDIFVGKEISLRIVSEKDIRLVYDRNKADIRSML